MTRHALAETHRQGAARAIIAGGGSLALPACPGRRVPDRFHVVAGPGARPVRQPRHSSRSGSCSPRFVPRRDAARISSLRRCCGSARRTATSSGSAGRDRSARSRLLLGVAPGPMSAASWALYLSFVTVGREFLSFQWDGLLLETGLHATLVTSTRPGRGARAGQPPWLGSVLMRWLAFRLNFQSGFVKLESQDPTWRRCTACAYHYETQPLPTRLGWYAHHLPRPLHRVSTAAALAVELGAPFLVFAPRRAAQAGILGSGGPAGADRRDRQLRLLQRPDRRTRAVDPRRRQLSRPATAGPRRPPPGGPAARRAGPRLRADCLRRARRAARHRVHGEVRRSSAEPPSADAPRRPEPAHRSPSLRERVRPVRRHDDVAARDRGRRIE